MSTKSFLLRLAITCVLATATAGVASAGAWIQWDSGPQIPLTKVEIPLWERQSDLEHYVWQIGPDWYDYADYEFNLSADYPGHVLAVGGGDSFVDENNLPIYVRIGEAVLNAGTEPWIDFHIRVSGGGYPYKVYGGWWPSDWNITSVNGGWDFMRDPGGTLMVQPGQTLYDEVWIRVDPQVNSFTLDKWPTVPEPGSLLGLASGLAVLGAGLKFRRLHK